MRDLTKSMMSFSWALSLFGLRQMTCMLTPRSWNGASSSFDHVTRSTEDHLGSVTRSLFRAGDNLQRGMVDLMFNLLSLGRANGGRTSGDPIRSSVQWGADAVDRSAEAIRQAASGPGTAAPGTASGQPGETGWGPMPGTR